MGAHCSVGCKSCYVMCLVFPAGTCWMCHTIGLVGSDPKEGQLEKISAEDVAKAYHDMTVLNQPVVLCELLQGQLNGDKSACTVDFGHADKFIDLVTGIDTPQQLCSQVDGEFSDNKCIVNVAHAGEAPLNVKQAACGSSGGQWVDGTCALI